MYITIDKIENNHINIFSTVINNNSNFNKKSLEKSVLTPEQLENLTKDQLLQLVLQLVQVNQGLMKEKTDLKEENHYLKQELSKCQENLQEVLEPNIQNYTFKELLSKKETINNNTSKESSKKEPITNPKKITLKECLQKETKQQKNRRYFYKSKLKKKIELILRIPRDYLLNHQDQTINTTWLRNILRKRKKIIITPYTAREYLKKLIQVYSHVFKMIENGQKGRSKAMTIGIL